MPNLIRLMKLCTLVFLASACVSNNGQSTMMLDYKDFGPQVIAYEVIGNEWLQWEAHGAPDPTITYDIKVIVYRNIDLDLVKKKFPVDAAKQKDYRYLEYSQSITYLDKHISENFLTEVTQYLIKTREKINHHLQ